MPNRPRALELGMATYLIKKRLIKRESRFPVTLMLEPLEICNLACHGCGRIREYVDTIKDRLSVAECLASVDEAGTPIVSICGGEPMIYPEIGALVRGILRRNKHIYLCTNGMFIKKKLHEFRPTSRFFFNVHLDGLEETHDIAVERKGVFAAAIDGIIAAKNAGFLVCTNTTIYKETDLGEIQDNISEAERTIDRLDAALSSSNRFNIFPSLADKRNRAIEILEDLFSIRTQLATHERAVVKKHASGSELTTLADLQEKRQKIARMLSELPNAEVAFSCLRRRSATSLSSQVETPGRAAASTRSRTSATTRLASRSLPISALLLSATPILRLCNIDAPGPPQPLTGAVTRPPRPRIRGPLGPVNPS